MAPHSGFKLWKTPTNFPRCLQGSLIVGCVARVSITWSGADLGQKLPSPSQAYGSMKTKLDRQWAKKSPMNQRRENKTLHLKIIVSTLTQ